jgi:hypothetical protein
MALPQPPPIDYTSRDYLQFREMLLNLAAKYVPEWTDFRESDFGVVMVELESAVCDSLSFYTDRIAGEFLLPYVSDRRNMVNLMELINYNMSAGRAASVTLSVSASDSVTEQKTLDSKSRFSASKFNFETRDPKIFAYTDLTVDTDGQSDLLFVVSTDYFVAGDTVAVSSDTKSKEEYVITEVVSSINAIRVATIPSSGFTTTENAVVRTKVGKVLADEGTTIFEEILGTSDGTASQEFRIAKYPVINNSQIIEINSGSGKTTWTRVETFIESSSTHKHYTADYDELSRVIIEFGDGTNGDVPTSGSPVVATYRVGGGALPNYLQPGTISGISKAASWVESVTNESSPQGGEDPETIEQARDRGPRSLRANNRAVTAEDYKAMALEAGGVSKASAKTHSSGWNSVALYVVPDGGGVPTAALKTSISDYINARKLITTTLFVLDPVYYSIDVTLDVVALENSLASTVRAAISEAITDFFTLENVDFGEDVYRSDITNILEDIDGVDHITYSKFTSVPVVVAGTQAGNPTFGTVAVGPGAIEETWTVTMTSTTEFEVEGSVSGVVGSGTLNTLFTYHNAEIGETVISFTITGGTVAPFVNDYWTFGTEDYESQHITVDDSRIPVVGTITVTSTGGQ